MARAEAIQAKDGQRARKIGGTTLRSIGDISRNQRLEDNDKQNITPRDMLAELGADNQALTATSVPLTKAARNATTWRTPV
jgi:DNA-binding ferritin-like protein